MFQILCETQKCFIIRVIKLKKLIITCYNCKRSEIHRNNTRAHLHLSMPGPGLERDPLIGCSKLSLVCWKTVTRKHLATIKKSATRTASVLIDNGFSVLHKFHCHGESSCGPSNEVSCRLNRSAAY